MTWPDPLLLDDGSPVETAEDWQVRRLELIRHFENAVYGPWPAAPESVSVTTVAGPRAALSGTATLQELEIKTSGPHTAFQLLVLTPAGRRSPAPVFLAANFFGNHRVLADPAIAISRIPLAAQPAARNPDDRGAEEAAWDVEQTIAAGYAFATFCMSEVVPDDAELASAPLSTFLGTRGSTGAISAWAWAFSRCLDVLGYLPDVDPDRAIAVGHSRLGKAALWAAAVDQRIAAVIPSQSGAGGAAPSRTAAELTTLQADGRPIAETVAAITSRFPHWFAPAYGEFADRVSDLPVDQHELLALCAPRPVLLPNAVDDRWADPEGQFEMLRRADAVYRFLGAEGLDDYEMPAVDQHGGGRSSDDRAAAGRLSYSLRAGGHSLAAEDWPAWRAFADRWVGSGRFLGHAPPTL